MLVTVWSPRGVLLLEMAKPLVVEAVTTPASSTQGLLHAVLPCRAAVVAPDPLLCGRDHPPAPGLDRVAAAEAEPRPSGPAGPGPPAQGRAVHTGRGRVRGQHRNRLAVRERDRRAAGGPRPQAPQGGPGREEGRDPLRGARR